jgi:hypothetical protein
MSTLKLQRVVAHSMVTKGFASAVFSIDSSPTIKMRKERLDCAKQESLSRLSFTRSQIGVLIPFKFAQGKLTKPNVFVSENKRRTLALFARTAPPSVPCFSVRLARRKERSPAKELNARATSGA